MTKFLHKGNNTFNFQGPDSTSSSPIEVFFPKGKYFVELFGASGGGLSPGKGGYTYGLLKLNSPKTLYFYIGGQGINNIVQILDGCIKGGWNGGGEACSGKYQSSGGGATDIRLTKNDNYNDRIMVAGGVAGMVMEVIKQKKESVLVEMAVA